VTAIESIVAYRPTEIRSIDDTEGQIEE